MTIIKAYYQKIFCENHIAAYDETTETGISAPLFNIKDAIYVAAEAWENVSQSVIRDCWIKTGILPDNYFNTNLVPIYHEPTEEFLNLDDTVDLTEEIQSLTSSALRWPLLTQSVCNMQSSHL